MQAAARAGSLRIIAIASPQRASGVLADVPTWREHGVNVVQDSFRAVMGAKDLGSAQIAYWDSVLSTLARSAQWKNEVENNYCVNNYQPSTDAGTPCVAIRRFQKRAERSGIRQVAETAASFAVSSISSRLPCPDPTNV